jgi:hypothetical protein
MTVVKDYDIDLAADDGVGFVGLQSVSASDDDKQDDQYLVPVDD